MFVMFATGTFGMVTMSGDREKDVRDIVIVMHEIGVGGLNLEIVMDNESSLQSVVECSTGHVRLPELPSEICVSGETPGQASGARDLYELSNNQGGGPILLAFPT